MPKGKSRSDEGLKYLIERRGRWLVRINVPHDLRGHPAFVTERGEPRAHVEKYLGTDSKAKAKILKRAVVDEIRASFERARAGGPVTEHEVKAIAEGNLRRAFDKLAAGIIDNLDRLPELQEHVKVLLDNPDLSNLLAPWSGHPLLETPPDVAAADDLKRHGIKPTAAAVERQTTANLKAFAAAIAMLQRGMTPPPMPDRPAPRHGAASRLDAAVDDWLATMHSEPKTKAMARANVVKLADAFPHVADVTAEKIQGHVNRLAREGAAVATLRRLIGNGRAYWRYLASLGLAPKGVHPFDNLVLPRASKKPNGEDTRKPFDPGDVVRLLHAAEAKGDGQLAHLIKLAMFTGARREELCSLKAGDVKLTERYFVIADAKSKAGLREVPLHSALVPTLRKLARDSKDGYLLSGLPETQYHDRGDAIGKRFTRLKASMDFGEQYVFHSIRKTVTTLLEKAAVSENVAADILGHEKPRITYGLYSGGSSMAQKREAIEKLSYPGL